MSSPSPPALPEQVDVLIIGAGLSGIGAACYLQREHPQKSYALLEARGATGGTWDLFRYPGIRSDSDLHTFGYAFKPWRSDKVIADADSILAYLRETAAEHGVDRKVRLHHKVRGAAWSSPEARWVVDVERTDTGERLQLAGRWLFCASGYYRYDQGFTPRFEGTERFQGKLVHPQHWPEDLDYAGQRVIIIGSGATAMTLAPAMAQKAAHVTLVQRTPSYVLPAPSEDLLARPLRKLLPEAWVHAILRRANIAKQRLIWRLCQRQPRLARRLIRALTVKQLPRGYPVDEHFNPPYAPWDQRPCVVPDGDLFKALRDGRASMVTDRIETFTERGLRLQSGRELEADLIITATGLNLLPLGGMALTVDGEPVNLRDKVAFRGLMLSGVPNLAIAVGYTNSSWTLKIGLLCEHFCRLLAYMDARGYTICRPELEDLAMPTRPLLDFAAGYVQRSVDTLPRQGTQAPWLMSRDYHSDVRLLRKASLEDPHLKFSAGPPRDSTPAPAPG